MFGDDFDRLAIAGAFLTLYASMIFAVGWVVGKLLHHFGVI